MHVFLGIDFERKKRSPQRKFATLQDSVIKVIIVSEPHVITGLTTVAYTFAFNLVGIPLSVKTVFTFFRLPVFPFRILFYFW